MFDRQNETLVTFLRRFPTWYLTLRQPWRGLLGVSVLSLVILMSWLEIRDVLQSIGL